ncbi:hypothetical protein IF1G_05535 [Cordyceps javanica]|uniref:Uncharacterized protein n=1 Tax=Cordyceps javanica TaxID=43265 RepID=A0A545V1X4_9HYPO|nr:hypothetical protein IF1G_05535 [Cordyceps javanica]TQW07090.1 hypothetical protein IF2G_05474 [Cordyceps javanica]
MACDRSSMGPDAGAARRLALEHSQQKRWTAVYSTLRQDTTATISDEKLVELGLQRGPLLDIDNLGAPSPGNASSHFFSPCDWTRRSLDCESHSGYTDSEWMDYTRREPSLWLALDSAQYRFDWFKTRLLSLESIEENVWEPAARDRTGSSRWHCLRDAIHEQIGLELPQYEFYWNTLNNIDHEYRGTWAYFATSRVDKPHSVCAMLDSMCPAESVAARSEAHFDLKLNRLILRQSRVLDLSGVEAPPDAWLMLRWMASAPIGPTLYQPFARLPEASSKNGASRAPRIAIPG